MCANWKIEKENPRENDEVKYSCLSACAPPSSLLFKKYFFFQFGSYSPFSPLPLHPSSVSHKKKNKLKKKTLKQAGEIPQIKNGKKNKKNLQKTTKKSKKKIKKKPNKTWLPISRDSIYLYPPSLSLPSLPYPPHFAVFLKSVYDIFLSAGKKKKKDKKIQGVFITTTMPFLPFLCFLFFIFFITCEEKKNPWLLSNW